MRKIFLTLAVAFAALSGTYWLFAADDAPASGAADTTTATAPAAPEASADEQAVRTACANYVKCVNSGDFDAIMNCWNETADYTNDSGETFKGRAAIRKLFEENLPKEREFSFVTTSLRLVAPNVAIEDGIGKYKAAEGEEQHPGAKYMAVWVRSGDHWQLSSVRDLGDLPSEAAQSAPLDQLDWMVGNWECTEGTHKVAMTVAYSLDKQFLTQKYNVKKQDGDEFTVVTMIGWDPLGSQLRSWFFDSRGGFGDGYWERDGNTWTINSNGVLSDARQGTAVNVWKYIDDDHVQWTASARELEGVPLPDVEMKFVRKQQEEVATK